MICLVIENFTILNFKINTNHVFRCASLFVAEWTWTTVYSEFRSLCLKKIMIESFFFFNVFYMMWIWISQGLLKKEDSYIGGRWISTWTYMILDNILFSYNLRVRPSRDPHHLRNHIYLFLKKRKFSLWINKWIRIYYINKRKLYFNYINTI